MKGKVFTSDPEEIQEPDGSRETGRFHERDLHILLYSFVCADEHFKCMTKTIYHEVSKREKSGKNRWLHPDIVGVHFPFDSYTDNTLKLFDVLKVNPYKLYSFEMKISLSLSNLRECYFQAVSNSSWAHEGYLAALHISEEPELMDELRRRSTRSFTGHGGSRKRRNRGTGRLWRRRDTGRSLMRNGKRMICGQSFFRRAWRK